MFQVYNIVMQLFYFGFCKTQMTEKKRNDLFEANGFIRG